MPLPIIIVAAFAVSVYLAGRKTGDCSSCGTAFRPIRFNKGTCKKCGATTCDSCLSLQPHTKSIPESVLLIPTHICPNCLPTFQHEIERYTTAINEAKNIESFPETFKGKTNIDSTRSTIILETDWCKTKQEAELQLKVACAFLGYGLIVDRKYTNQENNSSSYVHSEWKASGKLGYKLAQA